MISLGNQVYIERGRYHHRHGKVVGFAPMYKHFVYLRIYDERGEITNLVDLVPIAYVRAVVEHSQK